MNASSPQPRPVPTLRLVFWETTAACNLECIHCRRLEVARELSEADLTTAQARQMIDRLAQWAKPILVFSGGEPLMRPDLFELAAHARQAGLTIALATNGTLIGSPTAQRIASVGFDRVSISLDGADSRTHDVFRGLPGSFDEALAGLRHLNAAGVPTQVNCTIARHNAHQIPDVLRLAEQIGAVAAHFFVLVPVGCGVQIAHDQMLSAAEIEQRLGELADLTRTTSLQVKATCAPHYYRILRQKGMMPAVPQSQTSPASHPPASHPLHTMTRGCLAGTGVCFVSHRGEVFPCGYLPVQAGHILEQDLADIWANSDVFLHLRDPHQLKGRCGQCPFAGVCGGCRARAFYEFADYLAEEPYCTGP